MKSLKGANILVTGGTGFVGGHVVEILLKQKANVISTFIVQEPNSYFFRSRLDRQVTLVHQDVRDFDGLRYLINRFEIGYVIHLAAQPLVEVAYAYPLQTLSTNIMGTANVLEASRLFSGLRGVIVASSDKAYGKHGKAKYIEADELRGDHPYEVSKSATDMLCTMYAKTYGLPVIATRFGNIYGEGDLNMSRIVPGIMEAVVNKHPLKLRSNGTFVRDYLYVKDVALGYVQLLNRLPEFAGESFNFGSGDTLSVLKLIDTIGKTLNRRVAYSVANSAKNEIPYQSLDYSKIHQAIGWAPKYSVRKTAKQIFEWYQKIL